MALYAGGAAVATESAWQSVTVNDHKVPVRRSVLGQIQCASYDHRTCLWDQDAQSLSIDIVPDGRPWDVQVATDVADPSGVINTLAISSSGAQDELDRVGYIDRDGKFKVKTHKLNAPWMVLNVPGTQAKQIVMSGDRVGYLDLGGSFWVKKGTDLSAPWVLEAWRDATWVALTSDARESDNDRIIYFDGKKTLLKTGGLSTPWTEVLLQWHGSPNGPTGCYPRVGEFVKGAGVERGSTHEIGALDQWSMHSRLVQ